MVRNNLYIILSTLLLLLSSCQHNKPNEDTKGPLFTLSVTTGKELRAIVPNDAHDKLLFTWDKGRPDLQLYYKQNGKLYKGPLLAPMKMKTQEGTVVEIENAAVFSFRPSTQIDTTKPFTLYGVVAEQQMIKEDKIYVGVHPHPTHLLEKLSHNRMTIAPAYFKAEVEAGKTQIETDMKHLGCMLLFYVKNSTGQKLSINGLALKGTDSNNSFYYNSSSDPFMEKGQAPFVDIDNPDTTPIMHEITTALPKIEIPAGEVSVLGFWARPRNDAGSMQEHILVTKKDGTSTTINMPKLSRTGNAPQVGHAYHIYLDWKESDKVESLSERPNKS